MANGDMKPFLCIAVMHPTQKDMEEGEVSKEAAGLHVIFAKDEGQAKMIYSSKFLNIKDEEFIRAFDGGRVEVLAKPF